MKYAFSLSEKDTEILIKSIEHLQQIATKQENIDSYSRILSTINESIRIQTSKNTYLSGLSDDCKKLYVDFKARYGVDLYHSIAAVHESVTKTQPAITLEAFQDYYYEKYREKRPLLAEREAETRCFIRYVCERIAK